MLKVPFFCEAPQDRFGALPCSWDHATIGEQACRDVSLVPLHSCSIFHGTSRSPIVLGFQGLLRIASEFVGLYQAARTRWKEWVAAGVRRYAASVGLKNGRADAELPCFRCVWTPIVLCSGPRPVPGIHTQSENTLCRGATSGSSIL